MVGNWAALTTLVLQYRVQEKTSGTEDNRSLLLFVRR